MLTFASQVRCSIGVLAALGLICAGLSIGVHACSCAPAPEVKVALEQADAVFAGRVIGLQLTPRLSWDPTVSFATEDLAVKIAVSSWWKGDIDASMILYTDFTCCVCGFRFEIGEMYLVYATVVDGLLRTSACTRTKLLSEASYDDLGILGNVKPASGMEPGAGEEGQS